MEDSLAGLSNDAKVLYALMLDRASISKVNGFHEADGTIRLYFTVEQAQKKLHRSRQCVTRIFRELEYSGLICRKKQGLGKPALITLNYPSNAKLIRPKEDGAKICQDKGRKSDVLCSTRDANAEGHIFTHPRHKNAPVRLRSDKEERMNAKRTANDVNDVNSAEIPEFVFESLARSLLPVIQKYYESDDGKKAFAEWKEKKEDVETVHLHKETGRIAMIGSPPGFFITSLQLLL